MKKITSLCILAGILHLSVNVQAQWNTNGTHIFNSNSGNVGIGISFPSSKLHVDGGVLFSGGTGSTPVSGAGTRLMWIPQKSASNVYPNPANDKITVSGTYSNERAVIYDNTGNPVMSVLLSGEDPEIDTTQLKNGEHILHAGDMKIRFIKLNE